jgi:hypothetical protein
MHQQKRERTAFRAALMIVLLASVIIPFIPFTQTFAITAASVSSPFHYKFSVDGTLREASSMGESSSPYWWVNSGGALILDNGIGMTYQGTVPTVDKWRQMYASNNPLDTDNGTHPQNLLRLVSRSSNWNNVRLEASYKITADHFSSSPNRNASNGLLLMSRYKSGDTLYYAGIRVDGDAVIKKKKNGTYTTLASKQIFPGSYSEGAKVNLIPHNQWITLRSDTVTNNDGSVTIRLYMKKQGETTYTKILETRDTSSPITGPGHMGIRTDFMDVMFDNVKATNI